MAALLAVALLTMAGVRSVVMRAAGPGPASSTPLCSSMSGMAGPMAKGHHLPAEANKVCDFCSAAAQAPICASVPPIVAPRTVRYITWRAHRVLGPRGPPAVIAKARGPPAALLTV